MRETRRVAAIAAAGMMLVTGCTQDGVAPLGGDGTKLHQADMTVASLSVNADGTRGQGLSVRATVRFDDSSPESGDVRSIEAIALSESEATNLWQALKRVRSIDWAAPFGPNVSQEPPRSEGTARGSVRFARHSVSATDRNGDRMAMETLRLVDDATGRATSLGATLLYRNGRLWAVTEVVRVAASGKLSGLRVFHIGESGTPERITEISGVPEGTEGIVTVLGAALSLVGDACGAALAAWAPKPLAAQEAECIEAEMDMFFAATAFATAEAAMLLACKPPFTASLACAAAATAAGLAAAYLTWTTYLYDACVEEYLAGSTPTQQRSAGIGVDPATECTVIHWEISYDGGLTWHYLGYTEVC